MDSSPTASPTHDLFKSRGWLIAGGILSLFVGIAAIGSPFLYSVVIAQLLGIFALVSGVIAFVLAIFGRHTHHRVLEAVSGLLRIAAGIALLVCVASSVVVITLILAIFFIVEGVFIAVAALKMRAHQGWVWTLISGLAAIVLGVMIYVRWPSSSAWVLGTLFGINLIFSGSSLLALGLGARRPESA
jgi:uncharacterized membrane protein HdeD (DUF308 family)